MANVFTSPSGQSYEKESILGNGAFGTILKCKHGACLKSNCVIKRVKLARQTPQERFASVQEVAILQQLRHRNLVRGIDGWIEAAHTACLVMEYCGGGDLSGLLRSRKGEAVLEEDVCMILAQLASVVAYLHANGIIHRDIKTSNILLVDNGLLKLGDLGMCRHLAQPSERPKTTAGTLNYMSPELTREESYSLPTDVWGLGCVMFEVCSLRPAFHAFNTQTLVGKIRSARAPLVPKHYSQPLRDLLRSMLFQDEARRPTAEDILASECLQEARAKVEALFGGCHGNHVDGPVFSLAAIDPPLLALMVRFRSESGAELQLPEDLTLHRDPTEATTSACTRASMERESQLDTLGASTGGRLESVVVSERGDASAPDTNAPGAGRLHAGGWASSVCQESSCLSAAEVAGLPARTPQKAGIQDKGAKAGRFGFGSSTARLLSAGGGRGRGLSTSSQTLPGSATRMRAAARLGRT